MLKFSIRGQDRYRDRRTDVPNEVLQLEDRTYLLMEEGSNLRLEQAVGTVFSGTPINVDSGE
jgi:hypothetical protein|tara:strand:- start:121 stop:306 length:186 start_codon:yes stop_codon:yes gene_type:complete